MEQYLRQGLISDSKVLDIRQVDVSILHSSYVASLLTFGSTGVRRQGDGQQRSCLRYHVRNPGDASFP